MSAAPTCTIPEVPSSCVCLHDMQGLTFSMQVDPKEETMPDLQLLSFEIGVLERGNPTTERQAVLRHRYDLLNKQAHLRPYLNEDIANNDQYGARLSLVVNVVETGVDAGARLMRKALMIMTAHEILSPVQAKPFFQFVNGLQPTATLAEGAGEQQDKLVRGKFNGPTPHMQQHDR